MAAFVYIASSLDGFIATLSDSLDWLNSFTTDSNIDYGYDEFISQIDAIIMGRVTYEKVLTFPQWPYSKPVFILSNTLCEIPESLEGKVEIINGNLKNIIEQLKQNGFFNIYIDGGKTIQSFLKEDLIDEITITTIPIILGSGKPLFGSINRELSFIHRNCIVFSNGLVKNHYIKK